MISQEKDIHLNTMKELVAFIQKENENIVILALQKIDKIVSKH